MTKLTTLPYSVKITAIALLITTPMLFAKSSNYIADKIKENNLVSKELLLPAKVYLVPEGNDYNNTESEYCYKRMVQSPNIALFWHKEFGDDPMANHNEEKRFNANEALKECERFYDYYVNDLKLVKKGNSLSDKYKLLIYVFGGDEATAFGGGEDDKIGILWTPATRINKKPFGALAHEMAHCFQYIADKDNGHGPTGPIMEMSAQYMLWQVYPQWMTFENYHLVDFLKGTHYSFLHPVNMYHSPYVLEYWSNKHGKEFFGQLCRETQEKEDPVMTYKRINSLSQEQFNDEIFDAARRFITWDMKRIEKEAKPYANRHSTRMEPLKDGWFRIAPSNCPQNYGYNGIKLKVPSSGTKVILNFKGIAGADGYSNVKTELAGWRYGFLASLKNGRRVYSEIFKDPNGIVSFVTPKNTEYLWLVVSGAPTEHWTKTMGRNSNAGDNPDEHWPYQIKIAGTTLDTL